MRGIGRLQAVIWLQIHQKDGWLGHGMPYEGLTGPHYPAGKGWNRIERSLLDVPSAAVKTLRALPGAISPEVLYASYIKAALAVLDIRRDGPIIARTFAGQRADLQRSTVYTQGGRVIPASKHREYLYLPAALFSFRLAPVVPLAGVNHAFQSSVHTYVLVVHGAASSHVTMSEPSSLLLPALPQQLLEIDVHTTRIPIIHPDRKRRGIYRATL
ncbi:uncharacterized protein B0H18DRAFT_254606 [Fomitopsis serialis]|uniref:uncharacterized protein n=1 Tax=Fomitopsis serialis TaxID=139415 RepID=UPI0020073786|nr:uncharacterized protein B0H18DRAFT_254606 [Neoantrodia serialis]KAH9928317.1 hypothetical protein B0H18DRAFT_254606 [Neoantrodia serialis]